ncbi:MAG: MBL fold metallo-hydrolase [Candidatus Margulisiibacteriota bacterium]
MINKLKITVLSENIAGKLRFLSEHGLALHLEADDKRILFDTGASNYLLINAMQSGINLKDLDAIVLSHAHYDHTGGLANLNGNKVYIHENFFQPKYALQDSEYKFIGVPFTRFYYKKSVGHDFIYINNSYEISPGVRLICNFKKPKNNGHFYIKDGNNYKPDNFDDELAMTINTEKGLVIITGCAHSGITNIIDKAIEENGCSKIYCLFGGFHLSKLPEKEISDIARQIDQYKIKNIGISHCTGNILAANLKYGNVFNFNTGDSFVYL